MEHNIPQVLKRVLLQLLLVRKRLCSFQPQRGSLAQQPSGDVALIAPAACFTTAAHLEENVYVIIFTWERKKNGAEIFLGVVRSTRTQM